jgi:hypothetical protein
VHADGCQRSHLPHQAILKILKHSTDPAQPQPSASSSANYQGRDRENHHANDAIGLLLGIDLSGTMEVSDCFQIPPVDASGRGDKLDGALALRLVVNE